MVSLRKHNCLCLNTHLLLTAFLWTVLIFIGIYYKGIYISTCAHCVRCSSTGSQEDRKHLRVDIHNKAVDFNVIVTT